MNNGGIFLQIANGNFKLMGIKGLYRENLTLAKLPSLLMLFNFVLTSSIILFMYSEKTLVSNITVQLVLISPLILFIWDIASFFFVSMLSGASETLFEVKLLRLFGAQFLGVALWLLVLTHILYPHARMEVELIMCYVILTEFVIRTLRSTLLVSRSGAPWYYIILYFCTLEILPLFIVYTVIVGFSE